MSEPIILGLDTACGISVGVAQGQRVLARRWLDDSRHHVESLVPLIAEALTAADLTIADLWGLAVGMGPGPFTGLRVGIVAAATLAAVRTLPVRHVCSLDVLALAQAGLGPGEFVATLDARRHELYWARYDAAGRRLEGPTVSAPDQLPPLPVIGPGALIYPQAGAGWAPALADRLAAGPQGLEPPMSGPEPGTPRAGADLVRVDAGLLAARADELPEVGREPLYLRRPDAVVSTSRKSTLPTWRAR